MRPAVALLERHHLAFETTDVGNPDSCCRLHELTGDSNVAQASSTAVRSAATTSPQR